MSSRPDRHAAEHAPAIAALQAGDLAGPERVRAEALLADCPACAALHADLVTLRAAVRAMPAPPRRRDFRLTDADAARLRPSPWRRLVGWLAAPRSTVRPLATGLATLGIAGLVLTSLPGLGPGVATPAPAYQVTMGPADAGALQGGPESSAKAGAGGQGAAPTAAATAAEGMMGPAEGPAVAPSAVPAQVDAGERGGTTASRNAAGAPSGGAAGPNLAAVASVALLAAGLALFGARWAARRAGA